MSCSPEPWWQHSPHPDRRNCLALSLSRCTDSHTAPTQVLQRVYGDHDIYRTRYISLMMVIICHARIDVSTDLLQYISTNFSLSSYLLSSAVCVSTFLFFCGPETSRLRSNTQHNTFDSVHWNNQVSLQNIPSKSSKFSSMYCICSVVIPINYAHTMCSPRRLLRNGKSYTDFKSGQYI